jgi:hypothetical protein
MLGSHGDSSKKFGFENGKQSEPVPNLVIFYVTLLTMLSSSIKFLSPTDSWRKYGLALDRESANSYLYFGHAIIFSALYSLSNALPTLLLLVGIKKYKNYFINHLTIINNILLSAAGILILLA